LRWREVADGLEETPMVEPVDPLQRGEFNRLDASPRTSPPDDLCLVQPDDRLGKGVVVRVTDTADRGFDSGLGQSLRVADRQVLGATITMVNEIFDCGPIVER